MSSASRPPATALCPSSTPSTARSSKETPKISSATVQPPAHAGDLDSAADEPLADGGDASEAISRAMVRVHSALCADALGAMGEGLRVTTDYLKSRRQFGVTLKVPDAHAARRRYVRLTRTAPSMSM